MLPPLPLQTQPCPHAHLVFFSFPPPPALPLARQSSAPLQHLLALIWGWGCVPVCVRLCPSLVCPLRAPCQHPRCSSRCPSYPRVSVRNMGWSAGVGTRKNNTFVSLLMQMVPIGMRKRGGELSAWPNKPLWFGLLPWALCQQGPRRSPGTWLGTERAQRGGRRWPRSNHLGDGSARTSSKPGGMPTHPQGVLVLVVLSPGARSRLAPGCEYLGVRHTRPGAPCAAPGCGRDCRQAQKLKCFLMLTSTGHAEHFFQGCWKAHVLHAFKAGQIVAVQKMY